jgi:PDZ domain
MTHRLRLLFSSLLSFAVLCTAVNSYGADTETNSNPSQPLQGKAAAFGVLSEEIQAKMGFKCATDDNEDVAISDVVPGTAAADCALHKGDLILDAQLEGNALAITIQRDGQIFKARLRELSKEPPVFVVQKAKMDNRPTKPFTLNAEQRVVNDNQLVPENAKADKTPRLSNLGANRFALQADQNFKMLADYNMELIVDRSMSMNKLDCPDGLSRWRWCGAQAARLAQSLSPYVPHGLTIIPFATEYDVFEHATAQSIDYLFNKMNLQQGTRLFEPLTERLDNYFTHHKPATKPLLIVVITDGVPVPKFEPELVKKELVEASQRMTSPGEVTVIFCQIGSQDRFGQRYLSELDENLISYGARYHFVHTISFDDLQQMGLGPALVASMKVYAPMTPPTVPKPKPKAVSTRQFTK